MIYVLSIVPEISRQLGFLRFRTLDDSREFMERNFPTIYLYEKDLSHADSRGAKVRIAYSREREDRNRVKAEGEWTCKIVSNLTQAIMMGWGTEPFFKCTIVNYASRQRC